MYVCMNVRVYVRGVRTHSARFFPASQSWNRRIYILYIQGVTQQAHGDCVCPKNRTSISCARREEIRLSERVSEEQCCAGHAGAWMHGAGEGGGGGQGSRESSARPLPREVKRLLNATRHRRRCAKPIANRFFTDRPIGSYRYADRNAYSIDAPIGDLLFISSPSFLSPVSSSSPPNIPLLLYTQSINISVHNGLD